MLPSLYSAYERWSYTRVRSRSEVSPSSSNNLKMVSERRGRGGRGTEERMGNSGGRGGRGGRRGREGREVNI